MSYLGNENYLQLSNGEIDWCNKYHITFDLYSAVRDLFASKVDKGGEPYIKHLKRVTENVKPQFARIAFCHDVIEDCGVDEDWLRNPDFKLTDYEIETIRLLSHAKGVSYSDYIINISNSKNLGAMYVKMADLLDNMNLNRLRQMTKKDIDRVTELYIPAYDRISTKIWLKENLNNQEKGNE